jgi:hypothetical protein
VEGHPTDFVARDRARGLAWRLERVVEERHLAWRGAEVGMAALTDEAAGAVADLAQQARTNAEDVVLGRVRDRERGFLEVPFAVAMASVAERLSLASRLLERAGRDPAVRPLVLEVLARVLARLEAFAATYDQKRPLAAAAPVDVGRLVGERERERAEARAHLAGVPAATSEAPPPTLLGSDRHGLEDVLVLAEREVPEGPWRLVPPAPGRRLELRRGAAEGPEGRAAGDLGRAAEVLAWLHPAEARVVGAPEAPEGVRLVLGDPMGEGLPAALQLAAGPEARLRPEAERAVRALLAAPPWADGGPPTPGRVVALLGLLRAADAEVLALAPRLLAPAVAEAARALPREATRKAPVKRAVLDALVRAVPGLPAHRLDALAEALARGRLEARRLGAEDAATLLAAFGRDATEGAVRFERAIDLGPLGRGDVEALAGALSTLAALRRDLEAGKALGAADLTRLEQSALAVLGRLGRL